MYTIYSTPSCTFCVQAKNLLESKGLDYQSIDITQDTEALQKMKEMGVRTVPQIFLDAEYIGGYSELKKSLG